MRQTQDYRPADDSARGFTLLEVTIAVAIFSLVSISIFTTFRSGLRAYDVGMKTTDMLQTGRFAMDIISRDAKNVFLIPETAYNQNYQNRRLSVESLFHRAEMVVVEPHYLAEAVENLNNGGIGIDLSFKGAGDDSSSEVTFVTYQHTTGSRPSQPINLARVTYRLEEGQLARTQEDIFLSPMGPDGKLLERAAPLPEAIVKGVKVFSIKYGYYFDGQWHECLDWDSKAREKRVDSIDILSVDAEWREAFHFKVNPWLEQLPDDNLPGYMRVRLEVEDPFHKQKPRVFQRTISLANSSETHVPIPDLFDVETKDGGKGQFSRKDMVARRDDKLRGERDELPGEDDRERVGGGSRFYLDP